MSREKTLRELVEHLDADPQEFVFPATYPGSAPMTFVNPWGFIPSKLIVVGQNGQGILYWTVADQQQWTKEHLILENRASNITVKLLALP